MISRAQTWIALALIARLPACAPQDKRPDARAVQPAGPGGISGAPSPVAGFARMVGGEWKMTAQSGTSLYDTWHWGPGRQSLRVMTQGEAADHSPWRALGVVYWHPGRKQVCMLGLNPFERTVSDGTITFEGETAEAVSDLYQTGVRRKIAQRWAFEGPDRFHTMLLESDRGGAFAPLVEWDYFRSQTITPAWSPKTEEAPKPSERLRPLVPLLGQPWETSGRAKGEWADAPDSHLRWSVEWIPYADAVYAHAEAMVEGGEPIHVLDAYLYHHTGTGKLHCLALSARGGVYEGNVAVIGGGGTLQGEFAGYEGERVVRRIVQVECERENAVRCQMWSDPGDGRKLLFDASYRKHDSK